MDDINYKKIYDYWGRFNDQVTKWVEEDRVTSPINWMEAHANGEIDLDKHKKLSIQYNIERNQAVKKHISSTHTWIIGKNHWVKNNWYTAPFECKVCGMGAAGFDEIYTEHKKVNLENDIPSRDMHGSLIHRTCLEVQAARNEARKKHKGGKCIQCRTYKCFLIDVL